MKRDEIRKRYSNMTTAALLIKLLTGRIKSKHAKIIAMILEERCPTPQRISVNKKKGL
jgi:hypothetical protein